MGCIYRAENCKNHFKIVIQIIFLKRKEKKRTTWQLMWRNVRVAALNATLQFLVIYRFALRLVIWAWLFPCPELFKIVTIPCTIINSHHITHDPWTGPAAQWGRLWVGFFTHGHQLGWPIAQPISLIHCPKFKTKKFGGWGWGIEL